MRVGSDMILFTKKKSQMTILLMSTTFLKKENISEVSETSFFKLFSFDNVFIIKYLRFSLGY